MFSCQNHIALDLSAAETLTTFIMVNNIISLLLMLLIIFITNNVNIFIPPFPHH